GYSIKFVLTARIIYNIYFVSVNSKLIGAYPVKKAPTNGTILSNEFKMGHIVCAKFLFKTSNTSV
ncbi:MAG: hypothetical protein QN732_08105, partial [Nitrososphaeraceae archaeon]|nr:hypothetical protein [Nitrososphaeraceae archaeon]